MFRASICILLCLASVSDQPAHVIVSDTAGIRIVSLRNVESLPTVRVGPEPLARIGTVDGPPEYIFSRVAGAQIVDSAIIVADGSSSEIRQFDQRGEFLRRAGAKGEGPGEFAMLRWLGTDGDSIIIAWDLRNRRVSYLTTDLEFEGSAVLNPSTPYVPLNSLADGALLIWPFGVSAAPLMPGSTVRSNAYVAVGRPSHETLDTIALVSARPSYVDRSGEMWRLPFTVDPSFAVSASGDNWTGNGNAGEVRRYSRLGELELIVRLPTAGPIEESDVEEWLVSDPEHAADIGQVPVPDRYPVFSELASSPDGSIWIKDYASSRAPTAYWLVLDSSGLPKARAAMPGGEMLDLHQNQLLLLERDSLGVERVALYGIETVH